MTRRRFRAWLCAALAVAASCGPHDHEHDAGDAAAADERPTIAVTRWTERTELFMEYPVFVAGESGRAAIHVTDLADFSPLVAGEAIVALRGEDGGLVEFRGGPSRPGIFGVDLRIDRPGRYEMTLRVEAPGLDDLHRVGPVRVHARDEPLSTGGEEAGEAIAFLKEQQWTLPFATTLVIDRGLRASLAVPATLEPRTGGEARVRSPVPGRIDPSTAVTLPGARVRGGDLLARIVPRSDDLRDAAGLRASLVEAEQSHALAGGERDRAARLVAARALPARRLDEAQAALAAAAARLDAARERWNRLESLQSAAGDAAAATFAVRAPFDGVVSEVRLAPGAAVEENEVLLRLVDPDRLHVVGAVPEAHAATLSRITAAELVLDGQAPVALGRPLTLGPRVEPVTRTSEVRFALDNRGPRLQVGQAVGLRLFVGEAESGPTLPESAVVDDGGRPVVFVQTGGESFERRPVRLGSRAGGDVRVLEGVEVGERVVHRGAYLVRLAALSTQIPAHGHVH